MESEGFFFDEDFVELKQLKVESKLKLSEKLFDVESDNLDFHPCFIAVSQDYGLLAAVTHSGFCVEYSEKLAKALKNSEKSSVVDYSNDTMRRVKLPGLARSIAFSSDSESILVCLKESVLVFETAQVMAGNSEPRDRIEFAGDEIVEVCPNPESSPKDLFVILKSGNAFTVTDMKEKKNLGLSEVICGSWSPKGKQLVFGKSNGDIVQVKPTGEVVRAIPAPPLFLQDAGAAQTIKVHWIDNKAFLVVYASKPSDDSEIPMTNCYAIEMEGKPVNLFDYLILQATPKYIKMDDPCFNSSSKIKYNIAGLNDYGSHMKGLYIFASTSSPDAGLIVNSSTKEGQEIQWGNWSLPEGGNVVMPLNSDENDTFPFGIAVDLTETDGLPGPNPDDPPYPPCPRIWIYSNEGMLMGYHCLNTDAFDRSEKISMQVPKKLSIPTVSSSVPTSGFGVGTAKASFGFGAAAQGTPSTTTGAPAFSGFSFGAKAESPAVGKTLGDSKPQTAPTSFGFGAVPEKTAGSGFGFGAPKTVLPATSKREESSSTTAPLKPTTSTGPKALPFAAPKPVEQKVPAPTEKPLDQMTDGEVFSKKFDEIFISFTEDMEQLSRQMKKLSSVIEQPIKYQDGQKYAVKTFKDISGFKNTISTTSQRIQRYKSESDEMQVKISDLLDSLALSNLKKEELGKYINSILDRDEANAQADPGVQAEKQDIMEKRASILSLMKKLSEVLQKKQEEQEAKPSSWKDICKKVESLGDKSDSVAKRIGELEEIMRKLNVSAKKVSPVKKQNRTGMFGLSEEDLVVEEVSLPSAMASEQEQRKKAAQDAILGFIAKNKGRIVKVAQEARPPPEVLDSFPKKDSAVVDAVSKMYIKKDTNSGPIAQKEIPKAISFGSEAVKETPVSFVTDVKKPAKPLFGTSSFGPLIPETKTSGAALSEAKPIEKQVPTFATPTKPVEKISFGENKNDGVKTSFGFGAPPAKPSPFSFGSLSVTKDLSLPVEDKQSKLPFGNSLTAPSFASQRTEAVEADKQSEEARETEQKNDEQEAQEEMNDEVTASFGDEVEDNQSVDYAEEENLAETGELSVGDLQVEESEEVEEISESVNVGTVEENDQEEEIDDNFTADDVKVDEEDEPVIAEFEGEPESQEFDDNRQQEEEGVESPVNENDENEQGEKESPVEGDGEQEEQEIQQQDDQDENAAVSLLEGSEEVQVEQEQNHDEQDQNEFAEEPVADDAVAVADQEDVVEGVDEQENVVEESSGKLSEIAGDNIDQSINQEKAPVDFRQMASEMMSDESENDMDDELSDKEPTAADTAPKTTGVSFGGTFSGLGSSKPVSSGTVNPMFGTPSPSAFQTSSATVNSGFTSGSPGFGQTSAFGQTSFGKQNTTPSFSKTAPSTSFAQASPSPFGQTAAAATPAFGSSSFAPSFASGAPAANAPSFGSPAATPTAFGSSGFGAPCFGGGGGFGAAVAPTQRFNLSGGGFGAAAGSSFGSVAANPSFSSFGSAAVGGSSSFGSAAQGTTGFGSQQPASFGSFAQQGQTSAFGSVAQAPSSGFASGTTPEKPKAPSFSQYRG